LPPSEIDVRQPLMVPVRPSGGDAFVGKCSKTLFTVIVFRLGEPVPRLETYGAFLRGSCGRGNALATGRLLISTQPRGAVQWSA